MELSDAEHQLRAERVNMALAEIGFCDVLGIHAELLREDVPPPIVFRAWQLVFPELCTTYEQWLIDCITPPDPLSRWLLRHNAYPHDDTPTLDFGGAA